jgi:pyruvate,orthophosphate dikinase
MRYTLIEKIRSDPTIPDSVTIFRFDHDHGVPAKDLKNVLGGKGSGLAEMTRALGIAVPPGFTIPLAASRVYRASGWPEELGPMLHTHIEALGAQMGRRFGDANDPLLVAVRSGAPISMPGMLDTVLNLGLNDDTVIGLAEKSGDELFAWDSYLRFVLMFATTVMGMDAASLPTRDADGSVDTLKERVASTRKRVISEIGIDIPMDPSEQLRRAVIAVFESWNSARAKAYRAKEGIDEEMGTAVNVQAMVFGNRGDSSGTGVVFTRDPSTGLNGPYGDYLPRAQGEDVVAGTAHTLPISALSEIQPQAFTQLVSVLRRLEVHYRDMCDVEFTIEDGRLWLLQTRTGKRSAVAAVKIAADLMDDPDVRLSPREAAERVPLDLRARARSEVLARAGHDAGADGLLAVGLGASPGRVSGRIALDSESAADAEYDVILVRSQTSPEDVAGMASSVGILTTSGGLVSHAAVVARGWGIPAVVGAKDILLGADLVMIGDVMLHAGDLITIDGTTGEVWRGEVADVAHEHDAAEFVLERLPELAIIERCAEILGEGR